MWLSITLEQRLSLSTAWATRIHNRIDIKDPKVLEHIASYACENPTTKQAYGTYVAAITPHIKNWLFTSQGVHYSPTRQIYTG